MIYILFALKEDIMIFEKVSEGLYIFNNKTIKIYFLSEINSTWQTPGSVISEWYINDKHVGRIFIGSKKEKYKITLECDSKYSNTIEMLIKWLKNIEPDVYYSYANFSVNICSSLNNNSSYCE